MLNFRGVPMYFRVIDRGYLYIVVISPYLYKEMGGICATFMVNPGAGNRTAKNAQLRFRFRKIIFEIPYCWSIYLQNMMHMGNFKWVNVSIFTLKTLKLRVCRRQWFSRGSEFLVGRLIFRCHVFFSGGRR